MTKQSIKRKACKECPWLVRNNHNDKMIKNIERLVKNGSLVNKNHKCHMIDTNLWSETNDKNICVGSI